MKLSPATFALASVFTALVLLDLASVHSRGGSSWNSCSLGLSGVMVAAATSLSFSNNRLQNGIRDYKSIQKLIDARSREFAHSLRGSQLLPLQLRATDFVASRKNLLQHDPSLWHCDLCRDTNLMRHFHFTTRNITGLQIDAADDDDEEEYSGAAISSLDSNYVSDIINVIFNGNKSIFSSDTPDDNMNSSSHEHIHEPIHEKPVNVYSQLALQIVESSSTMEPVISPPCKGLDSFQPDELSLGISKDFGLDLGLGLGSVVDFTCPGWLSSQANKISSLEVAASYQFGDVLEIDSQESSGGDDAIAPQISESEKLRSPAVLQLSGESPSTESYEMTQGDGEAQSRADLENTSHVRSHADLVEHLGMFCFVLGVICSYFMVVVLSRLSLWWATRFERMLVALEKRVIQLLQEKQYSRVIDLISSKLSTIVRKRGEDHLDTIAFKHYAGKAHLALMESEEAVECLQEVVTAYEPLGEDQHLAYSCEDLARALASQELEKEALHWLLKAHRIFTEEGLAAHLPENNSDFGMELADEQSPTKSTDLSTEVMDTPRSQLGNSGKSEEHSQCTSSLSDEDHHNSNLAHKQPAHSLSVQFDAEVDYRVALNEFEEFILQNNQNDLRSPTKDRNQFKSVSFSLNECSIIDSLSNSFGDDVEYEVSLPFVVDKDVARTRHELARLFDSVGEQTLAKACLQSSLEVYEALESQAEEEAEEAEETSYSAVLETVRADLDRVLASCSSLLGKDISPNTVSCPHSQ